MYTFCRVTQCIKYEIFNVQFSKSNFFFGSRFALADWKNQVITVTFCPSSLSRWQVQCTRGFDCLLGLPRARVSFEFCDNHIGFTVQFVSSHIPRAKQRKFRHFPKLLPNIKTRSQNSSDLGFFNVRLFGF